MATQAERPLEGAVALVTGSTGEGMGRQIALRLAHLGAHVSLNYGTYRKSKAAAEAIRKEIQALGSKCIAVQADTRDEPQTIRMIQEVETKLGPLDIAVANAGGDFLERPLEELDLPAWKRVVDAELDAAFLMARHVLPGMRQRRKGRLIYVTWEGARRAYRPPLDYTIGKVAREEFALRLARAEEENGITVNVVAPGAIPNASAEQARDWATHDASWRSRNRSTVQDVADAVAWLCLQEARFVSGSVVRVPGRI